MIQFRQATPADIDFLIEAILESEKSGTDILSWSRILEISESETADLVRNVLLEEIEGQEWYIPYFYIAEYDGTPAAALSAWKEGEGGMPSGMIKAQSIAWMLPEKWVRAADRLQEIASIQLPRMPGALQLENIYTKADFRGKGLARQLIHHAISQSLKLHPEISEAEIQLMGENATALRSYTQCGFLKRAESAVSNAAVLNLLPGTFRISLHLNISHGNYGDQGKTQKHLS